MLFGQGLKNINLESIWEVLYGFGFFLLFPWCVFCVFVVSPFHTVITIGNYMPLLLVYGSFLCPMLFIVIGRLLRNISD